MAIQYSGSAKAGAFSPNKTLRLSEGSKENDERILSTLNDYNNVQSRNNNVLVENARQGEQGWRALAKFSSTLTDTLVKEQQKKNDAEYEAGIADAYLNGLPQAEQDQFDADEALVDSAGQATDDLAVEYEQQTKDGSGARQISESTGWRALGRARGVAQQAGAQYGVYMAQFQAELNGITDPQTYADRLAEIRRDYTNQFGGMSRGLMAKYMFPKMQEWETRTFLEWQDKNNELIAANQLEDDLTQFYAQVDSGNGAAGFEAFIRKHEKRLGGKGKAIDLLFENVEKGVQNGQITQADVEALGEQTITKDGKQVKVKDAMPRRYQDLSERIRTRRYQEFDNEERDRRIEREEVLRNIREQQAENGRRWTQEEKDFFEENWDPRLGTIPQEISGMPTVEQLDVETRIEAIELKIKSGLPLTEEDLEGLPSQYLNNYSRYLNSSGRSDLLNGASAWVTSLTADLSETDWGDKEKTEAFRNAEANIKQRLAVEFNRQLKFSDSPEEAFRNAQKFVSDWARTQGYTSLGVIQTTDDEKKARAIADGQKILKDNPEAFRDTILNQDAVDQLIIQIEADQGKPTTRVPMYFTALARDMKGIDAFDLANQQLQLAGHPGLVKPEVEQQIDSLPDAQLRELLRYKPTPSRSVRAAVSTSATGDGAEFLNLIASVESRGDYNAFNLGGSDGGHTAHGSGFGDAATTRWGRQLTQMTVGEVMELGSSPSSENRWVHAAGRYQIIPSTLRGLVKRYNIDTNALYDPAMQDQLARYLAYQRLSTGQGFKGLRNEWIGLSNVSNQQITAALGGGFNNPQLLLPGV